MNSSAIKPLHVLVVIACFVFIISCKQKQAENSSTSQPDAPSAIATKINKTLTLYASFDNGIVADVAKGDPTMYTVMNRKQLDSAVVGLKKDSITLNAKEGRYGGALDFQGKAPGYIYYKAQDNMSYSITDWEGTISFWLQLDPAKDLRPGFCDPIQITDSGYNDAGFWVDFTKENPRDFRLGVIGDRNSWNPNPEGTDNANPIFIDQLPVVKNPPFSRDRWTHVVMTFKGLNTDTGQATLYLNGKQVGKRTEIADPFTWEIEKSNILLGLSYIGLFDELSMYNTQFTAEEVAELYGVDVGEVLE